MVQQRLLPSGGMRYSGIESPIGRSPYLKRHSEAAYSNVSREQFTQDVPALRFRYPILTWICNTEFKASTSIVGLHLPTSVVGVHMFVNGQSHLVQGIT